MAGIDARQAGRRVWWDITRWVILRITRAERVLRRWPAGRWMRGGEKKGKASRNWKTWS
ncbi:hypothetical protein SBBP2_20095 [Burkholderiales bacterium]|nr:hypothetical protein SBBP2_20095 [Burkholderiales bacterium]